MNNTISIPHLWCHIQIQSHFIIGLSSPSGEYVGGKRRLAQCSKVHQCRNTIAEEQNTLIDDYLVVNENYTKPSFLEPSL